MLLAGLARDGGLYVPEAWPALAPDLLARAADAPYADVAFEVMWPFVEGSVGPDDFAAMVADAYATFDDPDVVPLRDLSAWSPGLWLAELFHGPTLAFKDVALQLVGRLFDHELARRGAKVTIVGATSGDTGSAAIAACRDRSSIEIVILHPGRSRLGRAAAPDDHGRRRPTCTTWRWRAPSTTARTWSRRSSPTSPSATGSTSRRSTPSTGPASWPRSSTTSPPWPA